MNARFPYILVANLLAFTSTSMRGCTPCHGSSRRPARWLGTYGASKIDGKPSDLPEAHFWWVVKGVKVFYGGEELAKYSADAATTPKCIDLAFHKPDRVYEGIYVVEGETLKFCFNRLTAGVKERPSDFSTEGKPNRRLLIFKCQGA